ncbi:VWA-like domain-containing protein [Anaerolineales bacterium HSG24]|nr:VWA-like domain-containing protein [Anaerolineales bacterium HSG24]
MSARERIQQVVERWFLNEPLLLSVWTTHRLVLEPRLQTIRVRQGQIEYNPAFINQLDKQELEAIMQIEATRILLKHPYTRRKENGKLAYQASNITLQEYLQTGLPILNAEQTFGTADFNQQYFEFYYYKLQELADQLPQQGASMSSGDTGGKDALTNGQQSSPDGGDGDDDDDSDKGDPSDDQSDQGKSDDDSEEEHEAESEPSPEKKPSLEDYSDSQSTGQENTQDWDEDDLLTERINEKIEWAKEMQSWGTISGNLREQILATLKPKLDYRGILRQFRGSIISQNRVLTRMKPSRRYGFLYMGSRRDFTTHLLVAVDVSGSMGHEDLQRGFSIINRFFKYGIETIDVIQFDTEIKGDPITLKRARREAVAFGRGGTDFRPIIEYIDQHRQYDGLVIFTDGYAPIPPRPTNLRTRVLWLFNHESHYEGMASSLRHIGQSIFLKDD